MRIGIDLDGTLLDSRPRHLEALRCSAKTKGVSIAEEDVLAYARLKADGDNGLIALRKLGISRAEAISREWINIIENDDLLRLDCLYENTLRILELECASSMFLLVTSRRNANLALSQIADLGLSHYMYDSIVVNTTSGTTKAMVSQQYRLEAIIGDTEIDLQWALDLRVPFYASCFGFRSRHFWNNYSISSYDNLYEIFDVLNRRTAG